jgi:hypothetical protein
MRLGTISLDFRDLDNGHSRPLDARVRSWIHRNSPTKANVDTRPKAGLCK